MADKSVAKTLEGSNPGKETGLACGARATGMTPCQKTTDGRDRGNDTSKSLLPKSVAIYAT